MKRIASLLLAGLLSPAGAQTVTYNGSMGDRAVLVIDGQAHVMSPGQTVQGVKLDSMNVDEARVEVDGRAATLRHGAPANLGGAKGGAGGQEIVLSVGPGGHFWAQGSIDNRSARFIVDTGATAVAMSVDEAERMGIDYRGGQRTAVATANGVAPAYQVLLTSVRIGDVEIFNVPAIVSPAPMNFVLLGNSFLSHFDMQRAGDTMRLTKKF